MAHAEVRNWPPTAGASAVVYRFSVDAHQLAEAWFQCKLNPRHSTDAARCGEPG